MNQKIINVELKELGEADILLFHLDDENPEKYCVNLNSQTSQNELKMVFSKLLEVLMKNDLELNYTIAEGYSKGLYKDVCAEYINDLNREIVQVKSTISRDLA